MDVENALCVVLVRHGETEGNVRGIVQGQGDTPLTERGVSSTIKKADKIRHMAFDAAFCSDLSRTVTTFRLLRRSIPELPTPVYTKELREMDFGDLTGQGKKELMPTILKHKAAPDLPYPNGESGGQFTAYGGTGDVIMTTLGDGSIEVTAVIPDPATMILLAIGGLALRRRK